MFDFPVGANTPALKYAYVLRIEELLRVLHNQMGDWYRDGYSKAQWNELPRQMKAKFSYSRQFTKSQWEDFLSTVYNSKVDDRSVAIAQCRAEMHEDNLFDVTIEGIL